MKSFDKGKAAAIACCEGGFEALQSMLKGEYTEESTGARTIRQTGGKDRHSKVFTARGPRDRRVRLSVATAIRFYDLQDRLGFEQPSKAVEWLLLNCQSSIQGLPQLASLHPMRIASALSTQPTPTYGADPPEKRQGPCKDERKSTHPQKEEVLDAAMHPSGEKNLHHYDYSTHHPYSLHSGLLPLNSDDPLQNSVGEDLSQYSNPSSSGGSSDHPEGVHSTASPYRATLAEAIANHTAASPLASMYGQCSTSFAPLPDQPIIHMSKRPRMQQEAGMAKIASSGGMIGKSLIGAKNELSTSQLRCSGIGDPPGAGFNRLLVSEEDAFLMAKFSLQSQLQINEDTMEQQSMKLASYKPYRYVDSPQQLLAAQASKLAESMIIQRAANDQSRRGADQYSLKGGQLSTSNDHMPFFDSKMAFNQQQVDELVCSSLYASPSPSESTSINSLAAAYSKAAAGPGSIINNNNRSMVDDQKQLAAAANILLRESWNPALGLQ